MINMDLSCPWTESLHSASIYHNLNVLLYIIWFYTLTCELKWQVHYCVLLVCPVMSNTECVCVRFIQSTPHKLQTAMKHGPMCLCTESLGEKHDTKKTASRRSFTKCYFLNVFLKTLCGLSLLFNHTSTISGSILIH